jgi:APA family basic amino acid/polyamine antiporter
MEKTKYSLGTATSVVIANMIGTGVFASLGFQLLGITDFFAILTLWVIGGIIALFGAFCYSEIGSIYPESGGEYLYLSKIYHPSVGFSSGWLSATIGFAAPIALNSILFGVYFKKVFPFTNVTTIAIGIILFITLINAINHEVSGRFQKIFTALKVLILLVLIIAGFLIDTHVESSFHFTDQTLNNVFSKNFALSLVYVSFAYSGWNASAYISSEVYNPKKNIPLSILIGTCIVTILYTLLNWIFLKSAPVSELTVDPQTMEQKELGYIVVQHLFGNKIAYFFNLIICLFLISSISSMIIAGPRVIHQITKDYSLSKRFGLESKTNHVPRYAVYLLSSVSILILALGTFDSIITYTTLGMLIFSTATVAGVFILRWKQPHIERSYKAWGYPFTPIAFILSNLWIIVSVTQEKFIESCIGLVIIISGFLVYLFVNKKKSRVAQR